MEQLETDRLRFRQWKESDFERIADYFSKDEYAKYLGGVRSPEESWKMMSSYVGHYHLKGYSYMALEERNSSHLIGSIGIWNSEPWPEPELGYWLLPEYMGKGFITEAGMRVLSHVSEKRLVENLVSYIDPSNKSSINVASRLGASLSGEIELLDFGVHQVYRYALY